MRCLLKMLSDMLQSPQPLSHIHICPKTKVKLGSTESFYPAPPSSVDIATARNPSTVDQNDSVEPSVDSCNRYPSWVEVSINVDVR